MIKETLMLKKEFKLAQTFCPTPKGRKTQGSRKLFVLKNILSWRKKGATPSSVSKAFPINTVISKENTFKRPDMAAAVLRNI